MRTSLVTAAIVAAATVGITFGASAQQQKKPAAAAPAPTRITVYKSPT
jgi:hypothetical protein